MVYHCRFWPQSTSAKLLLTYLKEKKNRLKIEHFDTNLGPKVGMSSFQGLFQEYFDILQIESVPQIC